MHRDQAVVRAPRQFQILRSRASSNRVGAVGAAVVGTIVGAVATPALGQSGASTLPGASTMNATSGGERQGELRGVELRDEVMYHFMPLTWRVGVDPSSQPQTSDVRGTPVRFGTFRGMTDGLDYLQDLGFTSVWINPIFPSPAYHGYQHDDGFKINPRLGTEEEFLTFVREARVRGIKVYLDMVVYGISLESDLFRRARTEADARAMFAPKNDRAPNAAEAADHGAWMRTVEDGPNRSPLFQGYTFRTWTGERMGMAWFDLRRPEPRRLVASWATKWLDPNADGDLRDGVAGYRLDHVWERYPHGPDGWGYNLEPFWREWKEALRAVNPNVATFAEQAQWETTGAGLFGAFDASFTKPMEFGLRDAFKEGRSAKLSAAMKRTMGALQFGRAFERFLNEEAAAEARSSENPEGEARQRSTTPEQRAAFERFLREQTMGPANGPMTGLANVAPGGFTFLGIIGDHDVDRLASDLGGRTPGPRSKPAAALPGGLAPSPNAAPEPSASDLAMNLARVKAAAAFQFAQPFAPVVYSGDEIGMFGRNAGDLGSDSNDIPRREPFKWHATDRSPMTDYWKLDPRTIERRYSRDRDGRSVEEQAGKPGSLLEWHRDLIRIRRSTETLRRGSFVELKADSSSVYAFLRAPDESDPVLASAPARDRSRYVFVMNVTDRAVRTKVQLVQGVAGSGSPRVTLSSQPEAGGGEIADGHLSMELEPFGVRLLALSPR
ncbi:MAG: alpha-amylase family glycosyl hydrolase [Planctomycetota bacterium]|nr:alpha-amylase family glycosyl hydrolase [Planctomycetota bacterium]